MSEKIIQKELVSFEISIKKLSSEVSKVSSLWNDKKFAELSAAVRRVADQSAEFIMSGRNCSVSLSEFDKISQERY